ncbi:MAG: glycosyl hydrolase 115 family protein [Lachnospiraceae bacterium]
MAGIEFSKEKECCFIIPDQDAAGVYRIAGKVAKDVQSAAGVLPEVHRERIAYEQAVIAVTAGGETANLLAENYPFLKKIHGRRESYGFYLLDRLLPEAGAGLVIYGSDRLGTIYGLFHLSELLGITPFTFWGDSSCPSYDRVLLLTDEEEAGTGKPGDKQIVVKNGISREPSVKYRGFFINDEWPCFGNWTFSHFGGFTAEMYDHVFEYLLRMKGNYIWPAMWTSSFLLDGPGMASMELADEYGIYIGMSHHEPCMRSSEEWDLVKGDDTPYGTEWSYLSNKEGLLNYWEDGLKRSVGHNVFPTIGMRGERDSKMLGDDAAIAENVRVLKEIITNQRRLIEKHLEAGGQKVPQLFAVYKEVEDYYFGDGETAGLRGFEELEDVTLLLCEDNFGNMRALPKDSERGHKGGFGMYYHLDYHGDPISYEWVASTPLTKIWEQMTQAYEYGIRELWIVNVGDLKFQEYPLSYFMELAYDFDTWGSTAPNQCGRFTDLWLNRLFGDRITQQECAAVKRVLDGYLRLNGLRRPESLNDRIYHPAHYLEGRRMLELCSSLEQENEKLREKFREKGMEDTYFSMIYFPAAASFNLMKMHLYSGFNHLYAAQGKAIANLMGDRMEACVRRDEELAGEMAAFAGGKWNGMEQASHIGFTNWNDEDWRYPVRHLVRLPKKPRLVVSRADEEKHYTNQYFPKALPVYDFRDSDASDVILEIANGGQGTVKWKIDGACDWLEFSAVSGETALQDEVVLTVRKDQLPQDQEMECNFRICTETEFVPVCVKAMNKDRSRIPEGTYLPENGEIVIDAVHYMKTRKGTYHEEAAGFEPLENFGKYGSGMKVFPVTASFNRIEQAPALVYQIWAEKSGDYVLELHTSPANPLIYGKKLHLAVLDGSGKIKRATITGEGYKGGEPGCMDWEEAVLNQEHTGRVSVSLKKGVNQVSVFAQEAGLVLERLVFRPADLPVRKSYLGPAESKCVSIRNQIENGI